ncbi:GspE/PulE family protein [Neptuniibacter halophilus]|uniref:GspE/PulE family protein n=1 Tax=Neptuniibacter halophilus TaxID=651666 RepID=UPI002572A51D|nr:ATPase, T2SS/T4P/T4SS family [Neptuniibacter halophilus]
MNLHNQVKGKTVASTIDGQTLPVQLKNLTLMFAVPTASGANVDVFHVNELSLQERAKLQGYIGKERGVTYFRVSPDEIASLHEFQSDDEEISPSESKKLFSEVFDYAVTVAASDIHIFAEKNDPRIEMRVHGELQRYRPKNTVFTNNKLLQLCRFIYSSETGNSGTTKNSYQPELTQAATVTDRTGPDDHRYRLRYQDAEINGERDTVHVTLRLLDLDKDFSNGNLLTLGYESDQQNMLLSKMLKGAGGLVIFVGATGDGKTTTAATVLGHLVKEYAGRKMIVTVEDPVEFKIPGVIHTQVTAVKSNENTETEDKAWDRHLKALLRRDPDFILQGEMRNAASAKSAAHAALTGHTTLCTLHGNSAFDAYIRLNEMDLPWSLLSSAGFIKGIVFQRLLPRLCQQCSYRLGDYMVDGGDGQSIQLETDGLIEQGVIPKSLLSRLVQGHGFKHLKNVRFRNYEGCPDCQNGLVGRVACVETMMPDDSIREQVSKGKVSEAQKAWLNSRESSRVLSDDDSLESFYGQHAVGFTAYHHAIKKMLYGQISPIDVEDRMGLVSEDSLLSDGALTGSEVAPLLGAEYESATVLVGDV